MRPASIPHDLGHKPQETSIAVNPRDPKNLVASFHQAVGNGSDHHPDVRVEVRVAWSADGGESWTIAEQAFDDRYRIVADGSVLFDMRGHAYLVFLALGEAAYTTRSGQYVVRSIDGGRTWETPVPRIEHPDDHEPVLEHMPHLATDTFPESPHAGNVYVVWDRFGPDRPSENLFVRSTDGGETWSEPSIFDDWGGPCMSMTVGRDGTLYLMVNTFVSHVTMVISRDGGLTFEPPIPGVQAWLDLPDPEANIRLRTFPRSHGWPVSAMDTRELPGRLYVVWGDHPRGTRDIFAAASADGGVSWTDPVRVNDDPVGSDSDHVMQFAAVDPEDGALYIAFYDRRDDPDNLLARMTLARSTDGGRTFVNYDWSEIASDPTRTNLGDYIGLTALGGRVYGAWPETAPEDGSGWEAPDNVRFLEMDFPAWTNPYGSASIRIGIADFTGQRIDRKGGTK
jgi:hypothetical protein